VCVFHQLRTKPAIELLEGELTIDEVHNDVRHELQETKGSPTSGAMMPWTARPAGYPAIIQSEGFS
jgi:hypothetical protein